MGADAGNLYLTTPMDRTKYMQIPIKLIPQSFIEKYNLMSKVQNGFVYCEIVRGMYGLPQAGKLANDLIKKRLLGNDYFELDHTPGIFKHKWRPIWCTLTVDDFGIKYVGKQHAEHRMATLRHYYKMTTDWNGTIYCGITPKWNYDEGYVDISMPNYVAKNLIEYNHHPCRK